MSHPHYLSQKYRREVLSNLKKPPQDLLVGRSCNIQEVRHHTNMVRCPNFIWGYTQDQKGIAPPSFFEFCGMYREASCLSQGWADALLRHWDCWSTGIDTLRQWSRSTWNRGHQYRATETWLLNCQFLRDRNGWFQSNHLMQNPSWCQKFLYVLPSVRALSSQHMLDEAPWHWEPQNQYKGNAQFYYLLQLPIHLSGWPCIIATANVNLTTSPVIFSGHAIDTQEDPRISPYHWHWN